MSDFRVSCTMGTFAITFNRQDAEVMARQAKEQGYANVEITELKDKNDKTNQSRRRR